MDAVADVTETPAKLTGLPAESRASQVWTTRVDSVFLDTFGRPNENQDPPCERTPDSTVTQSLHLMNSRVLDGRIRDDSGRAARLAVDQHDDVVDDQAVIEDLMWAMVNSPEFTIRN